MHTCRRKEARPTGSYRAGTETGRRAGPRLSGSGSSCCLIGLWMQRLPVLACQPGHVLFAWNCVEQLETVAILQLAALWNVHMGPGTTEAYPLWPFNV